MYSRRRADINHGCHPVFVDSISLTMTGSRRDGPYVGGAFGNELLGGRRRLGCVRDVPVVRRGPQCREHRANDLHDVVDEEQHRHVHVCEVVTVRKDKDDLRDVEHHWKDEVARGAPEEHAQLQRVGGCGFC